MLPAFAGLVQRPTPPSSLGTVRAIATIATATINTLKQEGYRSREPNVDVVSPPEEHFGEGFQGDHGDTERDEAGPVERATFSVV